LIPGFPVTVTPVTFTESSVLRLLKGFIEAFPSEPISSVRPTILYRENICMKRTEKKEYKMNHYPSKIEEINNRWNNM
jgi:hypothetical protein